jgi:amino acid transporter
MPVAGGEVVYAHEIFGLRTCFGTAWFLSLVHIAVTAFEAISIGWIAGAIVPWIEGATAYMSLGEPVRLGSLALGLGGMVLVTFLNYRGAKPAARFQDVATYGFLALAAVFIGAGVLLGDTGNLQPLFQTSNERNVFIGILAVFVTAPFWYSGFQVIPQVIEEKAQRTSLRLAGRTILIAIIVAMVFYSLVVVSTSMTMPWESLIELDLPVATAFESAFASPLLAKIVLAGALLGLVTTWNSSFITATRILFAIGRARIIHPAFGRVHPVFGSPVVPVLFVGFIGCVGACLGRNALVPIVNTGGTVYALTFLLISVGLIKLRLRRQPHGTQRRTLWRMITPAAAATVSAGMVVISLAQQYSRATGVLPLEWIILLAWTAFGVFFWSIARRSRESVTADQRRQLILGIGSSANT